jgi:uncharacterized membrane protein
VIIFSSRYVDVSKGEQMSDDRTYGEKVSDHVAHFGGSWKFIFIFSIFLGLWVLINTLACFDVIAFDKSPFMLLNLMLSFIAAFQAPFIMMSQNRAEKKQDEVYRVLFREIKELVEQDLREEREIRHLENEIKEELAIIKQQQHELLSVLSKFKSY